MIWLISIGISSNHGSELLVGWQWLNRLNAIGSVTAIVSKVFDDEMYLTYIDRNRIHFIDTCPRDPDEINRKHVKHVYRFWRGARKFLKENANPEDIIVIVSPAATWFMPIIFRLPVNRKRIFYGPVGPVRLRMSSGFGVSKAIVTNVAAYFIAVIWRLTAYLMPKNISLRYEANWFKSLIGSRYSVSNVLPEVEYNLDDLTVSEVSKKSAIWMILYDPRFRKNFSENMLYGLNRAKQSNDKLVIIGIKKEEYINLYPHLSIENANINFLPRMARKDFQLWMKNNQPEIVNLSLSEGVPSLLLEALACGCCIHIYDVGGLTWLIQSASNVIKHYGPSGTVYEVSWDAGSLNKFRNESSTRFELLLLAIKNIMANPAC